MKQSKPCSTEVILSELMAAAFLLPTSFLEVRCGRTAHDPAQFTRSILTLEYAGLVSRGSLGWEPAWEMTTHGRSLLCQRPPYNCYRAIRDELAASGPLTASELESACRRQASDYSPREFMLVLWDMIHSCLVIDVTEPGDAHSTYDLPEHTE